MEMIFMNTENCKTNEPHIHVYINRIDNRLAFKIKDGYELELQMPEIIW